MFRRRWEAEPIRRGKQQCKARKLPQQEVRTVEMACNSNIAKQHKQTHQVDADSLSN